MTTELLSPHAFKWFITLVTGVVASAWLVYDAINLVRSRALGPSPLVSDKRFGYVVGVLVGVVGVTGCLLFHDVI